MQIPKTVHYAAGVPPGTWDPTEGSVLAFLPTMTGWTDGEYSTCETGALISVCVFYCLVVEPPFGFGRNKIKQFKPGIRCLLTRAV